MRARADERGQLTSGASSATREKGETARAAGVGALSRPTRRVVGRCGSRLARLRETGQSKGSAAGPGEQRPEAGKSGRRGGNAGPPVSLAGLKWKRGRFKKNEILFYF